MNCIKNVKEVIASLITNNVKQVGKKSKIYRN